MNFLKLLFSLRGRMNRAKFWLGKILSAALSIVWVATIYPSTASAAKGSLLMFFATIFLVLFQMANVWFAVIAIDVKRLHDMNLSGWWLAV